MKVLLVNGSPHKEGCTYTALKEVERSLNEEGVQTEFYWIGKKPISVCLDCGRCRTLKRCAISDSVNEFREMAKNFAGYVFGTPVYFAGVNGNLKSFMDRLFFSDLWGGNHTFSFKPAAAVVSARRSGCTAAYDQIHKYFGNNQMPIVTSTYWNMAFGMQPEETKKDEEGMLTMYMLGKNMAYLLKCIQTGRAQGVTLPQMPTDFAL